MYITITQKNATVLQVFCNALRESSNFKERCDRNDNFFVQMRYVQYQHLKQYTVKGELAEKFIS